MDPVWTGYITKQQFFELDKLDEFIQWLGRFAPGTKIDLVLRKHEEQCSPAQRGYYWGVIIKLISEHTGYEPDEVHDILKWKFLKIVDEKTGLEIARSTESLNTKERETYHEQCRRWAQVVLDVSIPLPNEVDVKDDKDQMTFGEVNNGH